MRPRSVDGGAGVGDVPDDRDGPGVGRGLAQTSAVPPIDDDTPACPYELAGQGTAQALEPPVMTALLVMGSTL